MNSFFIEKFKEHLSRTFMASFLKAILIQSHGPNRCSFNNKAETTKLSQMNLLCEFNSFPT